MTVDDIAELLRVSRMTVYRWVNEGLLPAHRLGKLVRIKPEALEAFIEAQPAAK